MINENLFTTIGKLIASTLSKKDIKKAIKQADEDPEIQSTLQSLEYHTKELDRLTKAHCARVPDSPNCKDNKKVRFQYSPTKGMVKVGGDSKKRKK
jgi:hypothetical protein